MVWNCRPKDRISRSHYYYYYYFADCKEAP
jgi:hypothetical protein